MNRFAIIESNSGYVWGVVDAEDALSACSAVDSQSGCECGTGQYEPVSVSELRSTRGVYDVRFAPAGFAVNDGQNADEIASVDAMPRAGVFGWVDSE